MKDYCILQIKFPRIIYARLIQIIANYPDLTEFYIRTFIQKLLFTELAKNKFDPEDMSQFKNNNS